MVGRQTPFLALVVPLILIGMVDGRRGIRQTWPAAVVGGVAFAIGQFACSNYVSVELTDIVASLLSAGAIVALLRVWQPAEPLHGERVHAGRRSRAPSTADAAHEEEVRRRSDDHEDSRRDVLLAYAPYVIIVVVLSLAQWGPIKDRARQRHAGDRLARAERAQRRRRGAGAVDVQVQLADHARHAAADLRAAHDARAARSRPRGRCASTARRSTSSSGRR